MVYLVISGNVVGVPEIDPVDADNTKPVERAGEILNEVGLFLQFATVKAVIALFTTSVLFTTE
jgi:hypothetical protein